MTTIHDDTLALYGNPNHKNNEIYKCDTCEFRTTKEGRLKFHKQLTHGNKIKQEAVMKCKLCPFKTGDKDIYKSHVKDIHAKMKKEIIKAREDIPSSESDPISVAIGAMKKGHKVKFNLEREVRSNDENSALIGSIAKKVEIYIIGDHTYIKTGIKCLSNGRQVLAVKCSSPYEECQGMAEIDLETMKVIKFPSDHSCAIMHTTVEVIIQ